MSATSRWLGWFLRKILFTMKHSMNFHLVLTEKVFPRQVDVHAVGRGFHGRDFDPRGGMLDGQFDPVHVKFGYHGATLMKDFCMEVNDGHMVAIVGHTGAL